MRLLIIIFLTLILCGCQVVEDTREIFRTRKLQVIEPETAAADIVWEQPEIDYTLLIEKDNILLSKYEPSYGCYLGSNLWDDPRIGGDPAAFDEITGKNHGLTAVRIALDEEIPEDRILKCVAARKVVLLTIDPPGGANPYDERLTAEVFEKIGRMNIPMFIDFFPYDTSIGYGAESYKRFYRKMWLKLRELAPNAAMVWTAYLEDMEHALDYYPGDGYADWVGLHVKLDINEEGEYWDYTEAFDSFCEYFQEKKPIMIASLSLSHYTTRDNSYYTDLCAGTLAGFYQSAVNRWPRIKAMVYSGYDEVTGFGTNRRQRNNYLITDEELLLTAYSESIAGVAFMEGLESKAGMGQLIKSPDDAILVNGELYIPENSVLSRLGKNGVPGRTEYIGGERCYSADNISEGGDGRFEVDKGSMVVRWLLY